MRVRFPETKKTKHDKTDDNDDDDKEREQENINNTYFEPHKTSPRRRDVPLYVQVLSIMYHHHHHHSSSQQTNPSTLSHTNTYTHILTLAALSLKRKIETKRNETERNDTKIISISFLFYLKLDDCIHHQTTKLTSHPPHIYACA
mmetsp:Transcript_14119/g.33970  ORF Transcript_14119/g.33970 Transcript_14119/m.33970 type:complete len:145 (+) Transcript_14119:436-870(+)